MNTSSSEALKIREAWNKAIKNIKKDYDRYGYKQWSLKPIYPVKIELWNEILGIAYVFVEKRDQPYVLCKLDSSFDKQINHLRRSLSNPVMANIIWTDKYKFINVYVPPD